MRLLALVRHLPIRAEATLACLDGAHLNSMASAELFAYHRNKDIAVKKVFDKYDTDGSGTIPASEVREAAQWHRLIGR